MTVLRLKEHGTYLFYCETRKAYLYMLNDRIYKINGSGVSLI